MKREALLPAAFIAALLFAHASGAKEIAGVTIPDEVTLDGSDKPLVLTQ